MGIFALVCAISYHNAQTVLTQDLDFIASPPQQHNNLPDSNANPFNSPTRTQPEPLLSLLTTSHPLLGTAIGGSLSAYSASKNYSPRFKSSAEYVERRFSPVVNTVGSVGRVTGVEGGVRWFLGGRRPSHHKPTDLESSNSGSNKRRKVSDHEDMDIDRNVPQDPFPVYRQEFSMQQRERRTSQVSIVESLPAYDDVRSPSYEAQALVPTQQRDDPISPGGSTWQSRLILSTSGLSIAMSEESLRSLKYCLSWLRWANEHIGKVIDTLRSVLEQYSDPEENKNRNENASITNTEGDVNMEMAVTLREKEEARTKVLNAKIASLKNDVLKTLKEVVDVVSRYAGGALPENARVLVRKHLTSLPQRFKLASTSSSGSASNGNASSDPEKGAEVKEGAHRVMVLAKEGLDMMAQVSGVLDGTIVSAEEWCERLGRKKGEEREREMGGSSAEAERDGREAMVNESEKSGADMLKDGQF